MLSFTIFRFIFNYWSINSDWDYHILHAIFVLKITKLQIVKLLTVYSLRKRYCQSQFCWCLQKKRKNHYPQINRQIIIGSISRRSGQFSGRSLFCRTKSNPITSPPETERRQFALYGFETCLEEIESFSTLFQIEVSTLHMNYLSIIV